MCHNKNVKASLETKAQWRSGTNLLKPADELHTNYCVPPLTQCSRADEGTERGCIASTVGHNVGVPLSQRFPSPECFSFCRCSISYERNGVFLSKLRLHPQVLCVVAHALPQQKPQPGRWRITPKIWLKQVFVDVLGWWYGCLLNEKLSQNRKRNSLVMSYLYYRLVYCTCKRKKLQYRMRSTVDRLRVLTAQLGEAPYEVKRVVGVASKRS